MVKRQSQRQTDDGDNRRRLIRAGLGLLVALALAAAVFIHRTPGVGPSRGGGSPSPAVPADHGEEHPTPPRDARPDRAPSDTGSSADVAADDEPGRTTHDHAPLSPADGPATTADDRGPLADDPAAAAVITEPVEDFMPGWQFAPQPKLDTVAATIGGERFELEMAITPMQQYRGLSNRTRIPPDGGMIFIFAEDRPAGFVMRRCLVPLDLLYLDSRGRITTLYEMPVEPYDTPDDELTIYPSRGPARFAIELRAGTVRRLGLQRGQFVQMPVEALKRKHW